MNFAASFQKYKLNFKFDAGTSRGVMRHRDTWFIKVWDRRNPSTFGIGEAAPLDGLSIDDMRNFDKKLDQLCTQISHTSNLFLTDLNSNLFSKLDLENFPSIKFALETSILDLQNGGLRKICQSPFSSGHAEIPINGLVWMGDKNFMEDQIYEKIAQGYNCIKIKIGSIDFATECRILEDLRKSLSYDKISIRLDANGFFETVEEALYKINILSQYGIHSLEQPIKAGREKDMKKIVEESKISIALDEELIGKNNSESRLQLLQYIKPQYIILKPTLLGGIADTRDWIKHAHTQNVGWWITSALESNIGLNAIAQFTSIVAPPHIHQGLGTGQLYQNNITSPLVINNGNLKYNFSKNWDLNQIEI